MLTIILVTFVAFVKFASSPAYLDLLSTKKGWFWVTNTTKPRSYNKEEVSRFFDVSCIDQTSNCIVLCTINCVRIQQSSIYNWYRTSLADTFTHVTCWQSSSSQKVSVTLKMAVSSSDFLLSTFFVLLIVLIVKWTKSKGRKFMNAVPGPNRFPVLGNYIDLLVPHEGKHCSTLLNIITSPAWNGGASFFRSFLKLLELVRKSVKEWAYMYGKRYVIGGVLAKVMITRDLQDIEVFILHPA